MKRILSLWRFFTGNKFFRFCLVGSSGMVSNLAVFFIFRKYFHADINTSAIAAFTFAVTQNYYFNQKWTFKHSAGSDLNFTGYVKYVGVNIFSLSVNLLAVNFIVRSGVFRLPELVAQAVGIVLGFLITYFGSALLVFAKKDQQAALLESKEEVLGIEFTKKKFKTALVAELKSSFKYWLFIFLAAFLVIYLGQLAAVIGSKSILKPVTIWATTENGQVPPSLERFMQLARAGNYTLLKPSLNAGKEWTVEGVFFKKVLLAMSIEDLAKLKNVRVEIGEKTFIYNKEQFLKTWQEVSPVILTGNLSGAETGNYKFFQSPEDMRFAVSRIPIYKSFFSSIINWAGDSLLFRNPLLNSFGPAFLMLFWFIFIRICLGVMPPQTINEALDQRRRGYIIFSGVVYAAIAGLILINFCLSIFYKPNIASLLSQAESSFVPYIFKSIRPKPLERLQFMLSAAVLPFLLFFLHGWLKKVKIISLEFWYKLCALLNIFLLGSLIYLGLSVSGFFFISDSVFSGELLKYFYAFLVFPLCFIFFLTRPLPEKILKLLKLFGILAVFIAFALSIVNVFDGYMPVDLDPVLFPVVSVLAGKSLLAPITSFYGLYPFFIAPIFYVIGFSVLKFSFVMAALMLISFAALYRALGLLIKNKTIYLLGFLSLVFYTVLATRVLPEYYFQYWPLRFVFPCLGFLCVAAYLKYENKLYYFLSFIVCALAVLWNLETGAVLFISFLVSLFFSHLANWQGIQKFIAKNFQHLVVSSLALGLVFGLFSVITKIQSSHWPDFTLLFRYQKLFVAGYLNIALVPPPHTWVVVAVIYLLGLLSAIAALQKQAVNFTDKVVFFLSILGVGLFAYYEGQSSDITLFRTSYPAIVIAIIFADRLWEEIKSFKGRLYGNFFAFAFIMFVLISVPFSLLYNLATYYSFGKLAIKNIRLETSEILSDAEFIKTQTKPKEAVFILASPLQAELYAESNTVPNLNIPSVADIVFPSDLEILINFLQTNKTVKVFVKQPLESYDKFDIKIRQILSEKYTQVSKSKNGMVFYILK